MVTGDIHSVKEPLPRQKLPDLLNPTYQNLFDLAVWRLSEIVCPKPDNAPPRLFPTVEKTRDLFFTHEEWSQFGDLESEYGRLSWMLSNFPERGIPLPCAETISDLLASPCVLTRWSQVSARLQDQAQAVLENTVEIMKSRHLPVDSKTAKEEFLNVPIDYEYSSDLSDNLSLKLFQRSSLRMSTLLSQGDSSQIIDYIQIHAFIRDPIGSFRNDFKQQAMIFKSLLNRISTGSLPIDRKTWAFLAAQIAQESAFLADPQINDISYMHFSRHQQLPYVYVNLHELPRAEFSIPEHVVEIMQEIMQEFLSSGTCRIIPIIVASVPSVSNTANKTLSNIIIDGNNRATATMILIMLATIGLETTDMFSNFDWYCSKHNLSLKWRIDLRSVLEVLYADGERRILSLLHSNKAILEKLKGVTRLPGLLVQESFFHTICLQRSVAGDKPHLLQPMHQIIHNDDSCGFALPARRSQAHGRPKDYVLLPLE